MLKFAISGKARSGKNTTAKLIQQYFQPNIFVPLAFSDSLKDIVKILFPWIPHQLLFGDSQYRDLASLEIEKYTNNLCSTPRDLIKYFAVKIKEVNSNIFIDNLSQKYEDIQRNIKFINNSLIIITDIRFINEFQWAKDNQFCTLRVKRNRSLDNDATETEQDLILDREFDYIIDNSRNLEYLNKQIVNICQLEKQNI